MDLKKWERIMLSVLRILAGLLFGEHGTQKLFSWPPSPAGGGHLPPMMLTAGALEVVGGLLIVIGLFTRPVSFVLAGEMAVAYFMAHASKGVFPASNGGDAAVLFCFIFLLFIFAGPGPLSVDEALIKRRESASKP